MYVEMINSKKINGLLATLIEIQTTALSLRDVKSFKDLKMLDENRKAKVEMLEKSIVKTFNTMLNRDKNTFSMEVKARINNFEEKLLKPNNEINNKNTHFMLSTCLHINSRQ